MQRTVDRRVKHSIGGTMHDLAVLDRDALARLSHDQLEILWIQAKTASRNARTAEERDRTRATFSMINFELAMRPPDTPRWRRFAGEVDSFVGRRVRTARLNKSHGQRAFADSVGLTQSQLSRVERGERSLRVSELIRIAIESGRSVEFFLHPPNEDVVVTGWEAPAPAPL